MVSSVSVVCQVSFGEGLERDGLTGNLDFERDSGNSVVDPLFRRPLKRNRSGTRFFLTFPETSVGRVLHTQCLGWYIGVFCTRGLM